MRTDDSTVVRPDPEVDAVLWCTPAEASCRLSYRGDRAVLRAFGTVPAETTMVLLVPVQPAPDQARRLGDLLACFAPDRILAAPGDCVRTMEPLAAALGRQIHSAPPPYRSEYDGDSGSAADLVGHLGAGAVSTALCLPDAVVKITVAALLGTLGPDSPTRTPVPVHRHPMDGDCLWALAFHAAQLVAADHYPDLTVPKP